MVGITSYGAYIPLYRLSRDEISRFWDTSSIKGERAVSNFDEDSLTMGVEAAIDCLNGVDRELIDGLYFSSTTLPYNGKESASILAAAGDLRRDIFTADFSSSLRAGSSALRAAMSAVKGGVAKRVLVVSSDCRVPAPGSEHELLFGDGAAAFLVGDADVAVAVEESYSITSDFMEIWKLENDTYYRTWEDRFIQSVYTQIVKETVSTLLGESGYTPRDFTKAVFYGPDPRTHAAIARELGFDPKTQVQDPLFSLVGNTGCALAPMMIVAALEEARAGDMILFASYGDGCDAYILRVTDEIEKVRARRGIRGHLESKAMLPGYGSYLRFRNMMEWEYDLRPPDTSSLNLLWRERNQLLRFRGQKCRCCGTIQYPKQYVCVQCQAKGDFDEVRLSDKKGELFSYSMDERAKVLVLPNVLAIVDFEGGGRFSSVMTDRDPKNLKVGMPVELTFRKIHDGSGIHNYYWKCRPVRCQEVA